MSIILIGIIWTIALILTGAVCGWIGYKTGHSDGRLRQRTVDAEHKLADQQRDRDRQAAAAARRPWVQAVPDTPAAAIRAADGWAARRTPTVPGPRLVEAPPLQEGAI